MTEYNYDPDDMYDYYGYDDRGDERDQGRPDWGYDDDRNRDRNDERAYWENRQRRMDRRLVISTAQRTAMIARLANELDEEDTQSFVWYFR